jgi:phage gp29-like protein
MANLIQVLTENLAFDSSGRLKSNLTQWTESNIYEIFRRMILTDDRIRGALKIRRSKALSFGWDVVGEDENDERALLAYKVLEDVDIIKQFGDVWTAVPFGLSLVEVVWEQREQLVPVKLIGISPEIIELKADGPLIKVAGGGDVETWKYPYKYILTTYDELFDSPEGLPVLAVCYWPWVFKRMGMKFWNTLLDKFGTPSLLALFDSDLPHASADDQATGNNMTIEALQTAIVAQMANLRNGGNAAISNVKSVSPIEVDGDGADYEAFLSQCNNSISIGVLGNTMTMDAQSRGSQALGTVHQEISEQVAREDTGMLAHVANTLLRWYVDLNFGVDVPAPRFIWDLDGETSWDAVKDAMDRGVPVSLKSIYYKIRGYEPEDEADAFTAVLGQQDAPGEVGMSRPFALLPARKRTP